MTILTGRLETLAKQIKPGETMADIGTDHGFLPIALFERGTCPKVIMADVSDKALSRAREHGKGTLGLAEENYRVGDGLSTIKPGEVDVVVLAGMGGILMTTILAADLPKAKTFRKFVLQPRNHPEILRQWLHQNSFGIFHECLVRERRNLCEIIVAEPIDSLTSVHKGQGQFMPMDQTWPQDDIRWEIPPWYGEIPDPLAKEYLHKKLEKERRVRREVLKGQSPDPQHIEKLDSRIDYLRNLYEKREPND